MGEDKIRMMMRDGGREGHDGDDTRSEKHQDDDDPASSSLEMQQAADLGVFATECFRQSMLPNNTQTPQQLHISAQERR